MTKKTIEQKMNPAPPFDLTDEEIALCREGRSGEVFSRKQPLAPGKPKKTTRKK